MMFCRISRSLLRSSLPSKNLLRNGRSFLLNEPLYGDLFSRLEGNLGLHRGYFAAAATEANKHFASKVCLLDSAFVLENPKFCTHFSTHDTPKKKNYENHNPNGEKEIPKGDEQESDSKEDSLINDVRFMIPFLTLIMIFLIYRESQGKQITFQEFRRTILEPGFVDHIVVTNTVAYVYVTNSPLNQARSDVHEGSIVSKGQYKYYYINIVSGESFKSRLEKAQKDLGIDPRDHVPVTIILSLVPTLLFRYLGWKMNGVQDFWWKGSSWWNIQHSESSYNEGGQEWKKEGSAPFLTDYEMEKNREE